MASFVLIFLWFCLVMASVGAIAFYISWYWVGPWLERRGWL